MMKVILRQDVEKLGSIGDVVDVAAGFARNYLLPKGMAYVATEGGLKRVEEEKRRIAKQEVKNEEMAREKAAHLAKLSLEFVVKATEDDQLYGSVSEADIAAKIVEHGFEVDKKMVLLPEPIKSLGVFTVDVRVHPEVVGQVKVWIVRE
jgi:large subunit ribosomal protein L9